MSYRWSLRACRLGQSGSPRSGKRTDSLVKVEKFTRSSRCGFVAQWLERATRIRKTLGSIPSGAALFCFFHLIRLSVLLSLSELKEKRIWLEMNGFWKVLRRQPVAWRVGNSLSVRACSGGSCRLHVHTSGTLLFDWVSLALPSSFWRGIAFTAADCRSIRAAGYLQLPKKETRSLSLDSRVSGSLMMEWRRIASPYGRFRWMWGGWSLDGSRYWWVSVGFVNRSVTRCSPLIETDASRYGTDLPLENVNRISGWHSLAWAMKRSSATSP